MSYCSSCGKLRCRQCLPVTLIASGGTATIDTRDLWILVLGYMRYAIGRASTAPHMAAGYVRQFWPRFSAQQREQILRELHEEVGSGRSLGMDCDEQTWRELLAWCEGAIDEMRRRG